MKPTKETIAETLNMSEYIGFRLQDDLKEQCRKSNLVVIYGYSDDLVEFDGAIEKEIDMYERREFFINFYGHVKKKARKMAIPHKCLAKFCEDGHPGWVIEPSFPHAKFSLVRDGEITGQGAVIDLIELMRYNPQADPEWRIISKDAFDEKFKLTDKTIWLDRERPNMEEKMK
ncbi:hypothetical protein [uncultured Sphaerochaeta sp.]|mgnify:CR=1 FL=1|uniref:hypothetical protein n=1 Tax=uncultured Sphaerochaeta sp. TaxID=886478 RepID=UPI002604BB65|nr:hypothetical protein [uncultured Sphaerochaeta sp.]